MLKDKEFRAGLFWLVVWFIAVPAAIGYAWQTWSDHSDRECQKNRECKERQAEKSKYVVDDEMPDAANQGYYRGE